MKNLYVNPATNDIELDGQNSFKMVEGDDELVQAVGITFKTAKGSWFLNPKGHGFDRTTVQAKQYDESLVTNALFEAALQDERVENIQDITFDYDKANRKLSVDFKFTKRGTGEIIEGRV
ncbi:DUF2634 domain-containing protein [Lysinibacillus capsici]|uniref:contractile injection system sheath initiator n=1 Tax=Lysinibacillus capsici TaxID=2115968 RepID=UPI0034E2596E